MLACNVGIVEFSVPSRRTRNELIKRHEDHVVAKGGSVVLNRSIVVVAYLAILMRPTFAATGPEARAIYFESSGRQVAVDLVRPTQPGPHPAILLLYGRAGLSFYGPSFVQLSQKLTGAGFAVLTPHYFDASASPDSPEVTAVRFETWRKALQDALACRSEVSSPPWRPCKTIASQRLSPNRPGFQPGFRRTQRGWPPS